MNDIFGIAVVAAIAATLYEIRYAIIAALLVLALFKAGQYLVEWWKESGRLHRAEQLAIISRADRQHREVLAGNPHGVFGTDATQIVFRDVARFFSDKTEGFTKQLTRENAALPSGSLCNELTTPLGYDDPSEVNSFGTEESFRREFPIYPRPDWSGVVVVDLDA